MICSECGFNEAEADEDEWNYIFACRACSVHVCEDCGFGGMCAACDCDAMLEDE